MVILMPPLYVAAAKPLGLANTVNWNCWFGDRLAGKGPGDVVSQAGTGATPVTLRAPPDVLLIVTTWLCVTPPTGADSETKLGVTFKPVGVPPLMLRVT